VPKIRGGRREGKEEEEKGTREQGLGEGEGRREKGEGRREKGEGRWKMGDGRKAYQRQKLFSHILPKTSLHYLHPSIHIHRVDHS
jgi:hypothetical protein